MKKVDRDKDKVMEFLAQLELESHIRLINSSSSEKDLCNSNLEKN